MSYNEFMFEEAFEFQGSTSKKQQIDTNQEEQHKDIQRLPPLGACSNETTESTETIHGYVCSLLSFYYVENIMGLWFNGNQGLQYSRIY